MNAVLSLDAVRFSYSTTGPDILDISHLSLNAGERVLLRGPSGCGKSTLLALAAGVLQAQQGQVALLGRPWSSLRPAQRDAARVDHVGYIFQQFNLLPYLSVWDNVLLPCRFSRRRHERATQAHRSPEHHARELLQALDLDPDLFDRPASALSVGQQQRVAAARALMGQPELVIADEPTSALDEDRRDRFMHQLMSQCSAHRIALLFVSHDARLATHFDRTLDLPRINRAAAAPAGALGD